MDKNKSTLNLASYDWALLVLFHHTLAPLSDRILIAVKSIDNPARDDIIIVMHHQRATQTPKGVAFGVCGVWYEVCGMGYVECGKR